MKGASYGITLIVILLIVNLFLYIYGVEIPLTNWLNVGVTTQGSSTTPYTPTGTPAGGFSSKESIELMINQMVVVVVGVTAFGLATAVFFGTQWLNWGIPIALIIMFAVTFITPMGSIFGSYMNEEGQHCYTMRSGVVRFGQQVSDECVPWEIHVMLTIFFGVMILATFMTFIRGVEW